VPAHAAPTTGGLAQSIYNLNNLRLNPLEESLSAMPEMSTLGTPFPAEQEVTGRSTHYPQFCREGSQESVITRVKLARAPVAKEESSDIEIVSTNIGHIGALVIFS
jgi:hypothetical protein